MPNITRNEHIFSPFSFFAGNVAKEIETDNHESESSVIVTDWNFFATCWFGAGQCVTDTRD